MVRINLKNALQEILSESESSNLVRGYDKIGDVAIVIVPESLEHKERKIAEVLLSNIKGLSTVAKRVGNYSGEYRTIALKVLAGSGGLETLHREYGVALHLNPEKVYYSPRSSGERYRIAKNVTPGERVLVMFSGVAPLPLMIARHSMASEIYAIEKNPEAHLYALKNISINRWAKNIFPLQGDAAEVITEIKGLFNRIALVLPSAAANYLPMALGSLATGGWLHYYDFQKKEEFAVSESAVRAQCEGCGRKVLSAEVHKCGHISPGKYRICVDVKVH